MDSKVLVLDIETKPALAYVWRTFKENIGYEQVVEPGGLLCFAAKWVGSKETMFFSEWGNGRSEMIRAAHALFKEADAIVTYNGDKFDIAKLHGEFLLDGLEPPAPVVSIDLLKTVRKMGYLLNRLGFIGPHLRLGGKLSHEGFELWRKVLEGNQIAQISMEKYNRRDVALTEKLYLKIRPYIKNHPHLGKDKRECGACGSNHVQSRGWRRTKEFKIQNLQCVDCGSWQSGRKEKIKVE